MKKSKVEKLLRLPVIGFFIALLGALFNFMGWYLVESRTIAIIGFVLCVIGIVTGIVGVAIGQITVVKDAVQNKDEITGKDHDIQK
ncbi:MAG TPA: hypothetical protein VEC06_19650 [Paucimonas sp.]|nr:hypothetical protein [Paucimonas sp.]